MNDALELAHGRRLWATVMVMARARGTTNGQSLRDGTRMAVAVWGGLSPNMSQKWGSSAMCCGTDVRRVYFSVATSATDGDE